MNCPDCGERMPEQITVRPMDAEKDFIPKCIVCHKILKIRRPTQEEQLYTMNHFREKYDENISKPSDVWGITDSCICGQQGMVFYHTNVDKLK
jgi:hypothetical protein